jgi:hypothetical protein
MEYFLHCSGCSEDGGSLRDHGLPEGPVYFSGSMGFNCDFSSSLRRIYAALTYSFILAALPRWPGRNRVWPANSVSRTQYAGALLKP